MPSYPRIDVGILHHTEHLTGTLFHTTIEEYGFHHTRPAHHVRHFPEDTLSGTFVDVYIRPSAYGGQILFQCGHLLIGGFSGTVFQVVLQDFVIGHVGNPALSGGSGVDGLVVTYHENTIFCMPDVALQNFSAGGHGSLYRTERILGNGLVLRMRPVGHDPHLLVRGVFEPPHGNAERRQVADMYTGSQCSGCRLRLDGVIPLLGIGVRQESVVPARFHGSVSEIHRHLHVRSNVVQLYLYYLMQHGILTDRYAGCLCLYFLFRSLASRQKNQQKADAQIHFLVIAHILSL